MKRGKPAARKFGRRPSLLARIADKLILYYQLCISPRTGAHCRFNPTCSQYAREAISMHGFFRGTLYAAWRILRCNPFSKGGYDPVPPKKIKETKDRPEEAEETRAASPRADISVSGKD